MNHELSFLDNKKIKCSCYLIANVLILSYYAFGLQFWPIVGWVNYQYVPLQFRVVFHSFIASCWCAPTSFILALLHPLINSSPLLIMFICWFLNAQINSFAFYNSFFENHNWLWNRLWNKNNEATKKPICDYHIALHLSLLMNLSLIVSKYVNYISPWKTLTRWFFLFSSLYGKM